MQQLAGLKHVASAGIGHGDDSGLRGERLQPVRETVLRVLPVFRRGLQPLVNHAAIFLLRDQLAKRVFALDSPAFSAGSGQPVKGEALDALFFQMQEGAFDQRGVIRRNIVHRGIAFGAMVGAADADNRNVDVSQQLLNDGVVVVSDDAIAQPVFDVLQTGTKIFFDENIPFGLRRLQIFTNPLNHLTVIGFVGIE